MAKNLLQGIIALMSKGMMSVIVHGDFD